MNAACAFRKTPGQRRLVGARLLHIAPLTASTCYKAATIWKKRELAGSGRQRQKRMPNEARRNALHRPTPEVPKAHTHGGRHTRADAIAKASQRRPTATPEAPIGGNAARQTRPMPKEPAATTQQAPLAYRKETEDSLYTATPAQRTRTRLTANSAPASVSAVPRPV